MKEIYTLLQECFSVAAAGSFVYRTLEDIQTYLDDHGTLNVSDVKKLRTIHRELTT